MANKLDLMDLKQILQLHLDGVSNRQIGKILSISRNTINRYLQQFKASEYDMASLLKMDDSKLRELFTLHTTIDNERFDYLIQFFDKLRQDRLHPGFTFQYHYKEYKSQASNPYSYTQFMEHYRRKYPSIKGSMKLEHEAGKNMFIDYAGKHLYLTDKETGEQIPLEVFVAILPHSQYTYVEATRSQKREDLISSTANALSYYGGVPMAIVSDNLKSAVSRHNKYELTINRSFKDFARHYQCVINPTRPYSPQDKALVENAVRLVYQRIYYPLRNMTFFSLEEINKEIHKLLTPYNDLLFQRKDASRRELFQRSERSYLKPLPASRYEMKDYRRAKVQKMGYVYFSPDKSYYSVPYRFIGKHTQIHYTRSIVEVYYNHDRIAIHPRGHSKGAYHTIKEHLCSTHQAYLDWNPAYFKDKASKHGEYVLEVVSYLMDNFDYPEITYKRSMGIIQLHRQYGSDRLNKACMKALQAGTYSYHRIHNILKNNLEQEQVEPDQSSIPKHENTRGASYYQ